MNPSIARDLLIGKIPEKDELKVVFSLAVVSIATAFLVTLSVRPEYQLTAALVALTTLSAWQFRYKSNLAVRFLFLSLELGLLVILVKLLSA